VVAQNHVYTSMNSEPTTIEDMVAWLQSLQGQPAHPDDLKIALSNCIYRSTDPHVGFYLAHRTNDGERVMEKHSDASLRKCLHDLGEINYMDVRSATIDNIIRKHKLRNIFKQGGHDIAGVWREAFQ
jgi:hypothetical protein